MALPKYTEQRPSKLSPCQQHAVFSDAQDWKEYDEARKNIARQQFEQEVIDHANDLKKAADRLLRLMGRL